MDDQIYELDETPIVLLIEEGVMGVVVQSGAYASRVTYCYDGIGYDEVRDNDDFIVIDNIIFKHYVEE